MNTTLAPERQTTSVPPTETAGLLIRKGTIVIGATYSMIIAGMLIVSPELMSFVPLWLLWGVVMAGVTLAYVSGHVIAEGRSGRQSRRTRKFIAQHRS